MLTNDELGSIRELSRDAHPADVVRGRAVALVADELAAFFKSQHGGRILHIRELSRAVDVARVALNTMMQHHL